MTSQVVKVLEGLKFYIFEFWTKMRSLSSVNMVFIKKKSCFTKLMSTLKDWNCAAIKVIKALELMLRIWTLVKLLIRYPTGDFFRSWLALVLMVSCYYGLKGSCQIAIKG